MLPFKVSLLGRQNKGEAAGGVKLYFSPSSLGVLGMPVIMEITGEWDLCLLLEYLSQEFDPFLQANPLSCCASATLGGAQITKSSGPQ